MSLVKKIKSKLLNKNCKLKVQKQIRMMPGQEKMVMDFYQKNPSALASLRGTVYEEKIINLIKEKAKGNKKEISKEEAEKILKQSQNLDNNENQKNDEKISKKKVEAKQTLKKSTSKTSKIKSIAKKTKKVSKK